MEKDWVVVLYGDDSSHLASVNANVRTIDQVAEIYAYPSSPVMVTMTLYQIAKICQPYSCLLLGQHLHYVHHHHYHQHHHHHHDNQVCQLCAPLLVGQLLFFTNYLTTALLVAG